MHNYFTNYHKPICFDSIVSSSLSLWLVPCHVTLSILNGTVEILVANSITNSCIWNSCVTWQRYLLQAPWGWHGSVETCSSVIICEIIVHLLVITQNNKRWMVQGIKTVEAQQAKICNNYKNTRLKLLKTNAAIWFNKIRYNNCIYQQFHLKYLQSVVYRLPKDDTIVSKHVAVW